ncbi:SDR family NAD(P)-dependent oxidoreductase [Mycobacterium xenopi]|uniref:Short-chain dehydrogenase n=1 Tax=Mycobacterium xenopi TaxID=1789 RepID=A0AAD1M044_MYCXE|nr:SDR family NAD(P)-dependent oxidoreductase [Mycobacterium xenopi]MDA3639628.1 SDR family NAD(P)-dependent oxidoreductase [Mycobacterium xenopi]MDA3657878.1 SDR family NAD(P)-dependent oxidoreductase [Mycobacterium xenopi]MDA3663692.1 SDR family NAD(P)-dependent oxidoreductase [Mycobacterium xenopi]ORX21246.1 short-chain dehydrogenase [Mycobacterium xenopi]SPX79043.1 peroxisomal hydratase-dehydrogenase-epimerase (HDE) (multifunctionalbeta-oxidation protein) (MFP) [Mycobacterium xenopi]
MPEGPLSDRVVLVTGGGRGIGRAHCLALAEQGAAVVVNDPGVGRDGSGGDAGAAAAVVAEVEAAGGKAVAHTGSVSVWADAADMVSTAVDTFGTLTGVVNNAGIVRDSTVVNATEADWDAVIAVHLKGTFAVSKHACEYWRAQSKAGNQIDARIVNTISGAGLWGNVGQSAYGAAKAAIANLTIVTAMETRRYGVAVNAISPLAVTRISQDFFAGERSNDPALDPTRSSAVVAWLQSPESSWLTGQILRIDGHKLIRIEGFTEAPHQYHAKAGTSLQFYEIGQAVSWLYGTSPRGLAGPLPALPAT